MATPARYDTRAIAGAFALLGDYVSAEPYGSGHINDTFAVICAPASAPRYILQRINHRIAPVFEDQHDFFPGLHPQNTCVKSQGRLSI